MKLHEYKEEFQNLITLVAVQKHLPESAVERDYYIVMMLDKLANSEYLEQCVFKGGTSLSKCFPESIERFSEDIDLTYLGMEQSDKSCSKNIKKIEEIMTVGAETEKIGSERNDRNKSMWVWVDDKSNRIKLEIGSSVKPDPYSKRTLKTYIQEFLELNGEQDDIEKYELKSVTLNVLNIERTFIDKLMSVKRHAICKSLVPKTRHIYDVVRLYALPEIKSFLLDKEELKNLIQKTKNTDKYYMEKRNIGKEYNALGAYDFDSWKNYLDGEVKDSYENLHIDLLFTEEKQNFHEAIQVFAEINTILKDIGE